MSNKTNLFYSFTFSVESVFLLSLRAIFIGSKSPVKSSAEKLIQPHICHFFPHPANLHVFFSQWLVACFNLTHPEFSWDAGSSKGKSKLMGSNLHQYVLFLSHHHACGHFKCSKPRSGVCKECSLPWGQPC